ncbi:protein phosphatase 2C domain-containing protein [Streptomyces sp. VNUA24]|uniref:protein phosphatase 2C domain-containing protein n=1 Tax=Streptomyces sp. VNUA24 TaxID=3031131 RepID=UPI0023B83077|nr:protein phosphatase 2C domain-containing protein [Streptomyces sp. VNUA24]WEH14584.1 protein phosphatase 2C domain-containing protein [Streptomyces sp. VNUA24]
MSQQGERPTGHEDDWWRQLYDDTTGDTGPSVAADSLDDRFASAADTVGESPETPETPGGAPDASDVPGTPGASGTSGSVGASGTPGASGSAGASGSPGPAGPADAPRAAGARGAWGAVPGTSGAWAAVPGTSAARSASRGGSEGRPSGPVAGPDTARGSTGAAPRPPDRAPVPHTDRVPPQSRSAGSRGREGGSEQDEHTVPLAPSSPPTGATPNPGPTTPSDRTPPPPDHAPPPPVPDHAPAPPAPSHAPAPPAPALPPDRVPPPAPPTPAEDPRRHSGLVSRRAPWEPPAAQPSGPVTFPSGPTPPGVRAVAPWRGAPAQRSAGGQLAVSPTAASSAEPSDAPPPTLQAQEVTLVTGSQRVRVDYVGSGPPTYDAEPTTLPPADPEDLGDLVSDTVLDGARYGACTLRAASLRGDSARYRGEPRRDALLTARFGLGEQALVLVAMATGARATPGAHRAAAEACRWIGRAVGLSHARLVEDIRAARRGDLKSGLHRLTDRSLGKLRAGAVEQGLDPEEYTASLRCLLIPADPGCRTRVFFGVGAGGLFRLRDGEWQDIEPRVADTAGAPVLGFGSLPHETPEGDRLTMDLGITTPPSPYEPAPAPPREPFRFRASVAREEDVLLLCSSGLAEPLRGEAPLADHLASRWGAGEPPGLAAFLADAQVRVKGYADDRTAAAVWEA